MYDPALGSSNTAGQRFDYAAAIASATTPLNTIASGTGNYPLQFYPSPQNWLSGSEAPNKYSYNNVGTPTCTAFAPFSTKYHATSSQCIKMSDYITTPFLLEKAVFEIPVEVGQERRTSGSRCRDQDNYVFFMYRQQRKSHVEDGGLNVQINRDTESDVTGTTR